MSEKKVVVATHGHCFDGMCSAAMFTRLLRHLDPATDFAFTYRSVGYGPGQNGVDPKVLAGDVNAVLDFRFTQSPALTWYFDHHVSAFPSPDDRARYDVLAGESERRAFHDGAYGSCTKLIADVGRDRFGLDLAPTRDLVRWADMIDSASFPNAQMAVDRVEPVLQLMTVVEHQGDDAFLGRMVPRLLTEPVEALARSEEVQAAYAPMKKSHEAFVELVRAHARPVGCSVLVDLTSVLLDVVGKFVTYALYPESAYSIVVSRAKAKCKLSIGYNPWSPVPRKHNIATICERYGGGGHAVVGAISLAADKVDEAKKLGLAIAEELAG
jgi:hypothetical protein